MIKLRKISEWKVLRKGEIITFDADQTKVVEIEMHAPYGTEMHGGRRNEDGKDQMEFLCAIDGYETIQFYMHQGEQQRIAVTQDVLYKSNYDAEVHLPESEKPVITKLAIRKERDPRLEEIAARATENAERRLSKLMEDYDRRYRAEQAQVQQRLEQAQIDREEAIAAREEDDQPTSSGGNVWLTSEGDEDDAEPPRASAREAASARPAARARRRETVDGEPPVDA